MFVRLLAVTALSVLTTLATPALAHHKPGHAGGPPLGVPPPGGGPPDFVPADPCTPHSCGETVATAEPLTTLMVGAGLLGAIVVRRKLSRT